WADPQAHRGGVRLDQGSRRLSQDPSLGSCPRRLDVHPHCHGLQPGASAQAGGGRGIAMPEICPGRGKNRQNQCNCLLETQFSATTALVPNENSTKRVASTAFFRILLGLEESRSPRRSV